MPGGWAGSNRGSTRAWRATRARVLKRDPSCCLAYDDICTVTSTEVDHIVGVHLGGTDDDTNLQGVCAPCHQHKTQHEAARARQHRSLKRPPERHPGLKR